MSHQTTQIFTNFNRKDLNLSEFRPICFFKLKKSSGNIFYSLNNPENDFGIIYIDIAIFTAEKSKKMVNPNFQPIFSDLCGAQKFFVVTFK